MMMMMSRLPSRLSPPVTLSETLKAMPGTSASGTRSSSMTSRLDASDSTPPSSCTANEATLDEPTSPTVCEDVADIGMACHNGRHLVGLALCDGERRAGREFHADVKLALIQCRDEGLIDEAKADGAQEDDDNGRNHHDPFVIHGEVERTRIHSIQEGATGFLIGPVFIDLIRCVLDSLAK